MRNFPLPQTTATKQQGEHPSMMHVLTIAGSDCSGGAGIQADLKTFSALGTYGMSVITALTAQNTQGVQQICAVPADFVIAQCRAIFDDIQVDVVKIGMLANREIISAVAQFLTQIQPSCIVLDPVMIAKGGHPLLEDNAVAALREELLPLAHLLTPNLPEAAVLLGQPEALSELIMREQGLALRQMGCQAVLMKGGHLPGTQCPDILVEAQKITRFQGTRILTRHTHGTGCTFSSALAALYPRYGHWPATVQHAKHWLAGAITHADQLHVGHGTGPVNHLYQMAQSFDEASKPVQR